MAQLVIDIPDNQLQRIVDAFCTAFGYDQQAQPGEVKPQFAKRCAAQWVKDVVAKVEANQAAEAAAQSKRSEIQALDIR